VTEIMDKWHAMLNIYNKLEASKWIKFDDSLSNSLLVKKDFFPCWLRQMDILCSLPSENLK